MDDEINTSILYNLTNSDILTSAGNLNTPYPVLEGKSVKEIKEMNN